ncbi:Uncharacterised protein [Mycobacteroides abscessus subsp. abscessus]|nr:Uncharacterised protein [Mycobacteroides abscessus subsp. abscessus]
MTTTGPSATRRTSTSVAAYEAGSLERSVSRSAAEARSANSRSSRAAPPASPRDSPSVFPTSAVRSEAKSSTRPSATSAAARMHLARLPAPRSRQAGNACFAAATASSTSARPLRANRPTTSLGRAGLVTSPKCRSPPHTDGIAVDHSATTSFAAKRFITSHRVILIRSTLCL